jgi:hypothetical protein
MTGNTESQIIALAEQGMRPCEVAEIVGRRPATVYHYLNLARKRGKAIPKFRTGSGWGGGRFLVPVDPSMKDALAGAAAQRGIDPRELATLILNTVVNGGLIDAVLDDLDEAEGTDA